MRGVVGRAVSPSNVICEGHIAKQISGASEALWMGLKRSTIQNTCLIDTYCMNMTLIQVLEQDLAALRPPVTSRVEADEDVTLDVEAFIQSFNVLQGMLLDV